MYFMKPMEKDEPFDLALSNICDLELGKNPEGDFSGPLSYNNNTQLTTSAPIRYVQTRMFELARWD